MIGTTPLGFQVPTHCGAGLGGGILKPGRQSEHTDTRYAFFIGGFSVSSVETFFGNTKLNY